MLIYEAYLIISGCGSSIPEMMMIPLFSPWIFWGWNHQPVEYVGPENGDATICDGPAMVYVGLWQHHTWVNRVTKFRFQDTLNIRSIDSYSWCSFPGICQKISYSDLEYPNEGLYSFHPHKPVPGIGHVTGMVWYPLGFHLPSCATLSNMDSKK